MVEIVEKLPNIRADRQYWFVRTHGGTYFQDFVSGNYIGISWNDVLADDVYSVIRRTNSREEASRELTDIVKEKYPKSKMPTHTANQLLKFTQDIAKGDIVLIPSHNSQTIQFGEVSSSEIYTEANMANLLKDRVSYHKRKTVKWLKEVKRESLDPEVYRAIFTQHTLSNLNAYDELIDSTLHDFYVKGTKAYMTLEIRQDSGINAMELFAMGYNLLNLIPKFSRFSGQNLSLEGIEAKVHIQSPGKIRFSGTIKTLATLAAISVVLLGGHVHIDLLGQQVDFQQPGLIQEVINYQNSQADREERAQLLQSFDHLQVKTPSDVVNALSALNDASGDQGNSTNP